MQIQNKTYCDQESKVGPSPTQTTNPCKDMQKQKVDACPKEGTRGLKYLALEQMLDFVEWLIVTGLEPNRGIYNIMLGGCARNLQWELTLRPNIAVP